MTEITLHNTATRRRERLEPIDPANVRLYVCGPTVYDRAHLGNARPVVVFDTLYRLLRHVYGADHVTYVRNFTDVDDKINARAAATGRPIRDITDETIGWYLDDMAALGALEPDQMPRATEFIPPMIAMIETLIETGHAYAAEGHVLFAVDSYRDYGRLSGRTVEDMIAGARVEVAPYKRNPMDFVLWKPSDADTPGWDSPWGRGRPGWHIECSAMARELLGDSFDIHGGGIDLQFPHHENEIAQSCCAHPDGGFAKIWMHNEMLQVEGKKMSKSLGNFFTVRDLLDQGVPGEVIRFVFLKTHYSKKFSFSQDKIDRATRELKKWKRACENESTGDVDEKFLGYLCNNLDTAGAMFELRKIFKQGRYSDLKASANLIGILNFEDTDDFWYRPISSATEVELRFVAALNEARSRKDYERADELRKGAINAGYEVQIGLDGAQLSHSSGSADPAALEALL
ncbi:cysteine--tRNA ligase [Oceanomicrobium pacificus]|uniref:Cysteine--tRNA ligase n=1 Tax=Oceanomicrobium pacificus TaxID=2692916 RepID=A0A6B0TMW8_9RHOB|nr:cysteine--tRNA ligase [Oceanomicrobium pacificus]MXU65940.1 cysteine--tRNA ligase [Oceanomicrobium pacificus]